VNDLKTLLAQTTDAGQKKIIQGQIDTATAELTRRQGVKDNYQRDYDNLNTQLQQLQTTRAGYVDSRTAKVTQVAGWQSRLETITPTKLQLEADLNAARQIENEAYNVWRAAQSHADGIPGRIEQAFADFATTLTGFTLMANRLAAVPGMPDAGIDTELATLRKENKDALADLWNIMTQSREKLGTELKINEAINAKLKDVDDVQRAKIGLAFSSIFTSLQQALTSLAVLMDPASTNGGSNMSEKPPQRMRFAIGGTA
jgi:DNA repair exonuclease SbcCD ATPase subunit